jgi:hypothetical protein
LEDWASYFAYDVFTELALGRAAGMVKVGADVGDYMKSVLGLFYWSSNLSHVPGQRMWSMHPAAQFLIKILGTGALTGNHKFREFVTSAVGDRYHLKTKPDVPDMLISLKLRIEMDRQ